MTSQPCVLYVEDEARSRRVMRMLFDSMDLTHGEIFEDSANFLARAEALDPRPDIILLDIHVKPYNGFQMLEMLRQSAHYANTKIVALTASVMNEEVAQLKESSFDGCLSKPIDSDLFPELLAQIMQGEEIWRITS
jgi:two-component system, sensor histidine kinase